MRLRFDAYKFPKVFKNEKLERFAKLTHTIGNFVIEPKGFNNARSTLYNCDYWDYGMKMLKAYHDSASEDKAAWEKVVKKLLLEEYVNKDKDYEPVELWSGHFGKLIPQDSDQISKFLDNVNDAILKRGARMCEALGMK